MKQAKRVFSLLLALMMVFSLALTAAASTVDEPAVIAEETETAEHQKTIDQVNITMAANDGDAKLALYQIVKVMDTTVTDTEGDHEPRTTSASHLVWYSEELEAVVAIYPVVLTDASGAAIDLTNPANLETVKNTENGQAKVDAFYQWLAAQIRSAENQSELVKLIENPTNNANGAATVYSYMGLNVGGYLALADDGVDVYRPTGVMLIPALNTVAGDGSLIYPSSPQSVTMKSSKPWIDKTITDKTDNGTAGDTAQVSHGDTVTFDIETGVPTYAGDYKADEIVYTMVDIYRNAYSYQSATLTVTGLAGGSNDVPVTLAQNTNYRLITDVIVYVNAEGEAQFVGKNGQFWGLDGSSLKGVTSADAAKTALGIGAETVVTGSSDYTAMVVDFTGFFGTIQQFEKIHYQFDATITNLEQVSVETNTNEAKLTYSVNAKTPDIIKMVEDDVKSYTYGIDVNKHDGLDVNKKLNGVTFYLYEEYQTMNVDNFNAMVAEDTSGIADHYITEPVANQPDKVKVFVRIRETETLVTDGLGEDGSESGQLKISGLDVGEYRLKEISTQQGYNLLTAPVEVNIVATGANATGFTSGYVTAAIANFQGVTLPSTGGMGTVLFTMAGIVMMAGAMFLMILKRRREEETY